MALLAVVAGVTPPPRATPDADERAGPRSSESRPAGANERGGVQAPSNRTPPALAETRRGGTGEGAPPLPPMPAPDTPASPSGLPDPGPWLRGLLNLLAVFALLLGVALVARRKVRARTGPRQFRLETPTPFTPFRAPEPLEPFSRAGRDPRAQVTFAYRHLLAELADTRVPRGMEEAPNEYARRVARTVDTVGGPLTRLTRLYLLAEFSESPLEARDGVLAEDALLEARDVLRRYRESVDIPERPLALATASG